MPHNPLTPSMPLVLAKKVTLRSITTGGIKCDVVYCPAGLYVAGSGVRTQSNDRWLSRSIIDGTSHGTFYATEAEALADHARKVDHYGQIIRRRQEGI